jgi:hypothetical protein
MAAKGSPRCAQNAGFFLHSRAAVWRKSVPAVFAASDRPPLLQGSTADSTAHPAAVSTTSTDLVKGNKTYKDTDNFVTV